MTGALDADWLGICRRVVAVQRQIFEAKPGSEARTVYEGVGKGGDRSLEIDRRCEDVVFGELDELSRAGASFVAVSEERGEVEFGSGGPVKVVIDPIDGSLNARRTIPSHSLSIAVSSGSSMADVEFAYVYDFGCREEFTARRGEGASLGGTAMRVAPDNGRLELLGVESAEPERMLPRLEALTGRVYRLRVVGSIAIATCYVAAGRFDGMLSTRTCRSVDAAAAQLIVREAGGAVAFGDVPLDEVGLGIDSRFPIAIAAGAEAMATIREAGGETQ